MIISRVVSLVSRLLPDFEGGIVSLRMPDKEVSTNDLMEFLQEHMVTREELDFKFDEKLGGLEIKLLGEINKSANTLRGEMKNLGNELRGEINKAKLEVMDGMDDKLANLKGDLTVMMRGEDKKLVTLISLLNTKHVLSDAETSSLLSLQPFPQS